MKNNIFILLAVILMFSCVSLQPANTLSKAENKIRKYNTGIQNQIERFPSLVDKAYTYTITDTLFLKEESSEFEVSLLKIDSLLNEITKYDRFIAQRDSTIQSLMDTPLPEFPIECQDIVNELTKRNNILSKELIIRSKELNKVFNTYQEELNKRITGQYEDSIFRIDYEFYKGDILIKPTVKERFELYEKSIVINSIDIRKHFWQDIKFWGFLILLLNIFYFFNSLIYNILNSIFTGIKKFVMKLFTKI